VQNGKICFKSGAVMAPLSVDLVYLIIVNQIVMRHIVFMALAILMVGCNENPDDMTDFHKTYGTESANVDSLLNDVSKMIVVFGHQSVGNNILDGIATWEKESGVSLNRQSTRDMSGMGSPAFMDFNVGQNGNPQSKIDDFVSVVETIPSAQSPIAFFKFCYVDMVEGTDVDEVFEYYKERMLYLKENYSHVRIVLVTVPLTSIQTRWKAAIKKVLSREPSGYLENIKRQEINERIINELAGDFSVFDLALVESTLPDGSRSTYKYDGAEYPCMPETYTYDNGHLNDYGAKMAAFNLLAFLIEEVSEL
jgi:hypothetical protein